METLGDRFFLLCDENYRGNINPVGFTPREGSSPSFGTDTKQLTAF